MRRSAGNLVGFLVVGGAICAVALTQAGPIDPPAGPVAPTSPSLGDIGGALAILGGVGDPPTGLAASLVIMDHPSIDGDVELAPWRGWIDVESVSWSAFRAINFSPGAQRQSSNPELSEFLVTMSRFDVAAAPLFQATMNGSNQGNIIIQYAHPDSSAVWLELELEDALLTLFEPAIAKGATPTYAVSISATALRLRFWELDESGAQVGGFNEGCWSVRLNTGDCPQ